MFRSIGRHILDGNRNVLTVFPLYGSKKDRVKAVIKTEKTAEFLTMCLNQRERDHE